MPTPLAAFAGLSPAWAGEPTPVARPPATVKVYPRVGGGTRTGSRGKGVTWRAVYPRVGGGTFPKVIRRGAA